MNIAINRSFGDLIKFISCILVAFSHYYTYIVIELGHGGIFYKLIESLGGYLGVAFFFLLSGYGLMESDTKMHLNFFKYLNRRLSKVYLPTIIVTILWIPIAMWVKMYEYSSFLDLLYAIFWGFSDGAMWFIKSILMLYVVFYIFSYLYRKNKLFAHILFIFLIGLILVYNNVYIGNWSALSIPLFYVGVLMSINKNNPKKNVIGPLILISIIVCACSFWNGGISLGGHAVINYVSIIIFLLILMYSSLGRANIKFPSILGVLSFDVYLVHNKVLYVLKDNMEFLPVWLWIFVTIICTLLFYFVRQYLLQKKKCRPILK